MTIDPERYKTTRASDDDGDGDDGETPRERADRVIADDNDETLDQLLESYEGTGNFVYIRRQELGEWVFLAKVEIPDAKLDQIQSRFGGGKYRVQVIDSDTNRQKVQRTFRIAGKSKNDDDPTPEIRVPEPVTAKNGEAAVGLADVLKIAMTALTARPTVDPLMQTLITALVSGKRSGGDVDPLELQKLLQAAEDRGYNRGKELGEAIASAAGEGDGVARVLATTLPGVIDAFKSAQQSFTRNVPRATAHVASPAPAPTTASPDSPAPTTEDEAMGMGWISALRPAVPVILKWARDGKDAQVKAANTVDDLRDDVRDAIAVQAEAPDFVESVVRAIPEFQTPDVQPWVTTFLLTVQEILTAPDDNESGAETTEA